MPPLEVIRQILSQRKIYDRNRQVPVDMEECDFIAAATHPARLGSGHGFTSHSLPIRLTRLFTTLTMFAPGEDMLHSIYTVTLQRWLEEFPTKNVHHHLEFSRVRFKWIRCSWIIYFLVRFAAPTQVPWEVFQSSSINSLLVIIACKYTCKQATVGTEIKQLYIYLT